MNQLLQLITGKDNTTWDLGRISWALSFVAVIAHEAYQLAHNAGASARDFANATRYRASTRARRTAVRRDADVLLRVADIRRRSRSRWVHLRREHRRVCGVAGDRSGGHHP